MAQKKTTDQLTLNAEKRDIVGKKVKQLRRKGLIPANVFGPDIKSISVSVDGKEFLKLYRVARETGIIYVTVAGESIPTLVKAIQRHPLSHDILHVDFRKIDLKQKIETPVPVAIVGESPAVNQLGGVLLTQNDHLTVEALPQDIPQNIEVDISTITEIDQSIKVSDIKKSGGYEIKDDPETVIVSVIAHKEESVTPETTVETPEVITEGEPAAEGEGTGEEAPAAEAPASEEKE